MAKQLFLFGFPRSGTTLIRSRISQHPDIHLVNQPEILYGLHAAGYNSSSNLKITRELLEALKEVSPCMNHLAKMDDQYVEDICRTDEPLPFKSVYEKLLHLPENVKIWGEKSLNNGFFLEELSQFYPDSLFINIIRDPRSSILSKFNKILDFEKQQSGGHHKDQKKFSLADVMYFAKHAAFWSAWYQDIDRKISRLVPANRIINLKYEDFISQPKTYLTAICEKLGISYVERIIDYDSKQQDSILASNNAYAHQNIRKKIDSSRAYSYIEMSPANIFFCST